MKTHLKKVLESKGIYLEDSTIREIVESLSEMFEICEENEQVAKDMIEENLKSNEIEETIVIDTPSSSIQTNILNDGGSSYLAVQSAEFFENYCGSAVLNLKEGHQLSCNACHHDGVLTVTLPIKNENGITYREFIVKNI